MKARRANLERAFGKIDFLFCFAGLIVLAILFLPGSHNKVVARKISCFHNLKSLGVAFNLYANDAGGFPSYNPTNEAWHYFQIVGEREIGSPKIVLCPDDLAKSVALDFENSTNSFSAPGFRNASLSYFYNTTATETNGDLLLIGDHHISTNGQILNGVVNLNANSPVSWAKDIHRGEGNVTLANGGAAEMTTSKLREQLALATNQVERLALP